MTNTKKKYLDLSLLLYVLLLCGVGILFSYSSTLHADSVKPVYKYFYMRQIFYFLSGSLLMWLVSVVNYKKIASHANLIYIFCILFLIYTLIFGKVANNSKRWISLFGLVAIQPSEFVKLGMIIVMASYLDFYYKEMSSLKRIGILMGICSLPVFLIMMQPDLGTAMVFMFVFIAMLFMSNVNLKYFLGLLIIGCLVSAILFFSTYAEMMGKEDNFLVTLITDKYQFFFIAFFILFLSILLASLNVWMRNIKISLLSFYLFCVSISFFLLLLVKNFLLKPYQLERILVFLNPYISKWDLGYNVIQSSITIGSGGFWGKGIFQGSQGQLGFLPSRNTDFIFSVIGEEMGFVGSVFVIMLFLLFLMRLLKIAKNSKNYLGSLIVVGVFAMFSFQIFINIGMTISMAPVTGLPLPFLTYGGSTLWTSLIAVGLVFNVQLNRYIHK